MNEPNDILNSGSGDANAHPFLPLLPLSLSVCVYVSIHTYRERHVYRPARRRRRCTSNVSGSKQNPPSDDYNPAEGPGRTRVEAGK